MNGAEVPASTTDQRYFETAAGVEVPLAAGENRVELVFDDLAGRDTRFYVQLDDLPGPAADPAILVDCAPEQAAAAETALETFHVLRATQDGVPVVLHLTVRLGVAAQAGCGSKANTRRTLPSRRSGARGRRTRPGSIRATPATCPPTSAISRCG